MVMDIKWKMNVNLDQNAFSLLIYPRQFYKK